MLLKRIFAGLLCLIIAAGGLYYGLTFRFFERPLSAKAQEEFKKSINLPDNFTLAASADSGVKNSIQGVRQAVKNNAGALELNVAFNEKGVPYLADGPSYINEESVTLESVLLENAKHDNLCYILNLTEIASPEKLYTLLKKQGLMKRVILCGFSTDSLQKSRTDFVRFKNCVDLNAGDVSLKDEQSCRAFVRKCVNAGASYIRCSIDVVTPALSHAMQIGTIKLIVDDVQTDYEMYYALSLNPRVVITNRPAELYSLLYDNDYLNPETDNTF